MTLKGGEHLQRRRRVQAQVEVVQVAPFDDLEELWEQLAEFTGDGHGIGRDLDALYTVTVLESPDRLELVGLSNEWG